MRALVKKYGAAVLIALLVSLFLEPSLVAVWKLILNLLELVYTRWVDSLYIRAAKGYRGHASLLLLSMVYGFVLGQLTVSMLRLSSVDKPRPTGLSRKNLFSIGIGLTLGVAIVLGNIFIKAFTDMQLNASFTQRLTILAPAVPDQVVKELKSDWASMTGRPDYDSLNEKMEQLAAASNIILPESYP
ncbi:MAG: hypothetical protein OXI73_10770 [Rhodospirillales bacterium]|nr:hypothetical protein [Rhodospirillales bacterium]